MSRHRKLTTICAAVVLSLGLAACGGGGGSGPQSQGPNLTPAQNAAKAAAEAAAQAASDAATAAAAAAQAATDAATAATDAQAAVDAQTANKSADEGSYAVAQDAAKRAKTAKAAADTASADAATAKAAADTASADAATAKAAADSATTLADAQAAATAAQAAQKNAETAKGAAEDAQGKAETARADAMDEEGNAVKYAGMVRDAQQALDDDAQRVLDVASARGKAMQSYMDADTDATKAEGQADAAEATAPGTAGAMAARDAAKAARTAATNAKAAHDAITDGMTKAQADAKAADAASAASTANTQYMAAKDENDTIQTAHSIGEEQQRKAAIKRARDDGGTAVANAKKAADDAQDAANAAKDAADDANDAHTAAVNARTDATEAKKQADAADTAYMAAQAAADDAMAAYNAAKAAVDGVTDDSTTDEANAARMEAVKQEGIAEGHKATAMTEQETAEEAETKAVAAAGSYTGDSLGLLAAANDANETNDKTRKATINAVAAVIKTAATAGNQGGASDTVTASWLGNTPDNPATNNTDESMTRVLTVTLGGVGTNIVSDTKGTDRNSDDDTTDPGEGPNASMITGLTGFTHGFDISAHSTTSNDPDGRHAIIFTDKKQGKDQTFQKTVILDNVPVILSRVVAKTQNTNIDPDDLSNTANYDHDGDPNTLAVAGTFGVCAVDAGCITAVDGTLGSVVPKGGRIFSTDADGENISADANATENTEYLAFGVWLTDDVNNDDTTGDYGFGAVAGGGKPVADDGDITPVTGTATYRGAAMGVYTKGTAKAPGSVDYFSADATLTADFGKKGATATVGTVKGTIDNIMAGGMATGDVIKLSGSEVDVGSGENIPKAIEEAASISASGATFSGKTHMGSGTTKDNVTTYTYTGSWSGRFYNPARNAADTQDDLTKAPGSAAGTFGVTGTDDMGTKSDATDDVTTSYVGAFGAHKQ